MPKESSEVRAFLHCWVWRWDREDLHHQQCGGEGWICRRRFDPGPLNHSQGGFWALLFLLDHFWLLPKGFAIKKVSHWQPEVVVRVLKPQVSQLRTEEIISPMIIIPKLLAFYTSTETKGFCINLPRSSLTASETGLKSGFSGACDSSSLQESW